MTSEPLDPADSHSQPLTAERVRDLIARSIIDQEDIVACRTTHTVYADRLALSIEDRAGLLWRVHVLKEPRS
jgi:hypothetical protein